MTESTTVHAVPGYRNLRPLADGHSYEVFLAETDDGDEAVLRVFGAGKRSRGPEAPYVQGGVLRLLRGLLPVPEVVEVRADLLATTRLHGEPVSRLLESGDDGLHHALGAAVGETLGRLSGVPMSGPGGLMDDRLRVGLWDEGSESLLTWLDLHLAETTPWRALADLSSRQLDVLRDFAAEGDELLAVNPRAVLVHGDFSPRNLLGDPVTGHVTGVIDWEFAHAGHPVEDLGKLVRRPVAGFTEVAVEAMCPWLPTAEQAPARELARRARAADLYGLISSGSQRGRSPSADASWALLDRLTTAGDLTADRPVG